MDTTALDYNNFTIRLPQKLSDALEIISLVHDMEINDLILDNLMRFAEGEFKMIATEYLPIVKQKAKELFKAIQKAV